MTKQFINIDSLESKKQLFNLLKTFKGEYEVSIKKVRINRSQSQNAYYWGVVLPYVLEAVNNEGNEWSLDELHEFLKNEFLKEFKTIIIDSTERKHRIIKGTSELDTKEFTDYIDKIVRWSAEQFGCQIPIAN